MKAIILRIGSSGIAALVFGCCIAAAIGLPISDGDADVDVASAPTAVPTEALVPTDVPPPTDVPTEVPTEMPPTEVPPTEVPTAVPTEAPTEVSTAVPLTEAPAPTAVLPVALAEGLDPIAAGYLQAGDLPGGPWIIDEYSPQSQSVDYEGPAPTFAGRAGIEGPGTTGFVHIYVFDSASTARAAWEAQRAFVERVRSGLASPVGTLRYPDGQGMVAVYWSDHVSDIGTSVGGMLYAIHQDKPYLVEIVLFADPESTVGQTMDNSIVTYARQLVSRLEP